MRWRVEKWDVLGWNPSDMSTTEKPVKVFIYWHSYKILFENYKQRGTKEQPPTSYRVIKVINTS